MISGAVWVWSEEIRRTCPARGGERKEFLRAVFSRELRGEKVRGDKTEAGRGGGVTAPLPKRLTNAWLPLPSNETPGYCSGT
jgi:hypothetical protein